MFKFFYRRLEDVIDECGTGFLFFINTSDLCCCSAVRHQRTQLERVPTMETKDNSQDKQDSLPINAENGLTSFGVIVGQTTQHPKDAKTSIALLVSPWPLVCYKLARPDVDVEPGTRTPFLGRIANVAAQTLTGSEDEHGFRVETHAQRAPSVKGI